MRGLSARDDSEVTIAHDEAENSRPAVDFEPET